MKVYFTFKAFNQKLLDNFILNLIKKSSVIGFYFNNVTTLPTKKKLFTVLRSPHVNKKSREQFHLITHKRLLILEIKKIDKSFIYLLDYLLIFSGDIQIKLRFFN